MMNYWCDCMEECCPQENEANGYGEEFVEDPDACPGKEEPEDPCDPFKGEQPGGGEVDPPVGPIGGPGVFVPDPDPDPEGPDPEPPTLPVTDPMEESEDEEEGCIEGCKKLSDEFVDECIKKCEGNDELMPDPDQDPDPDNIGSFEDCRELCERTWKGEGEVDLKEDCLKECGTQFLEEGEFESCHIACIVAWPNDRKRMLQCMVDCFQDEDEVEDNCIQGCAMLEGVAKDECIQGCEDWDFDGDGKEDPMPLAFPIDDCRNKCDDDYGKNSSEWLQCQTLCDVHECRFECKADYPDDLAQEELCIRNKCLKIEKPGCMDKEAYNYDERANVNEGCVYKGCTDKDADNYDERATIPGECVYRGCMDPTADNYDERATKPGQCVYKGCTDKDADNYDGRATIPGECVYKGCMDKEADNYDERATKPGQCVYKGCMDKDADNYDERATIPGECVYKGCMDPTADNYDVNATEDDGTCTYPVKGCMDEDAGNYNPDATEDDGTCTYPVKGCTDSTADNYNVNATEDDGTCTYPVKGCTDPTADNYNPDATEDDGTCIRPGKHPIGGPDPNPRPTQRPRPVGSLGGCNGKVPHTLAGDPDGQICCRNQLFDLTEGSFIYDENNVFDGKLGKINRKIFCDALNPPEPEPPVDPSTKQRCPPAEIKADPDRLLFFYINDFRRLNGLHELVWDDRLYERSKKIAQANDVDQKPGHAHDNEFGKGGYPGTVLNNVHGFDGDALASQGFAYRDTSTCTAMQGWVKSEAHRNWVLSPQAHDGAPAVVGGQAVFSFGWVKSGNISTSVFGSANTGFTTGPMKFDGSSGNAVQWVSGTYNCSENGDCEE